jgi:hypothetical protein
MASFDRCVYCSGFYIDMYLLALLASRFLRSNIRMSFKNSLVSMTMNKNACHWNFIFVKFLFFGHDPNPKFNIFSIYLVQASCKFWDTQPCNFCTWRGQNWLNIMFPFFVLKLGTSWLGTLWNTPCLPASVRFANNGRPDICHQKVWNHISLQRPNLGHQRRSGKTDLVFYFFAKIPVL